VSEKPSLSEQRRRRIDLTRFGYQSQNVVTIIIALSFSIFAFFAIFAILCETAVEKQIHTGSCCLGRSMPSFVGLFLPSSVTRC